MPDMLVDGIEHVDDVRATSTAREKAGSALDSSCLSVCVCCSCAHDSGTADSEAQTKFPFNFD